MGMYPGVLDSQSVTPVPGRATSAPFRGRGTAVPPARGRGGFAARGRGGRAFDGK